MKYFVFNQLHEQIVFSSTSWKAPAKKKIFLNNTFEIYCVFCGIQRRERDFLAVCRSRKETEWMNEFLLMAYPSIKTNINKLVFTTYADPVVINATNFKLFFYSHNHCPDKNENTETHREPFEYLCIYLCLPFYAYSNTFDVIYYSVVHAIKPNSADNLCDRGSYRITIKNECWLLWKC